MHLLSLICWLQVAVGCDPRVSGPLLMPALLAGLQSPKIALMLLYCLFCWLQVAVGCDPRVSGPLLMPAVPDEPVIPANAGLL
jgi:phosphomannomutase